MKLKKLDSKQKILNLLEELEKIYPIIDNTEISNVKDAKIYLNSYDLLVRNRMFKETFKSLSDIIINIPDDEKNNFISRLKSINSQLKDMFHEFVVGKYFRDIGYNITYEPKLNGQHPDWKIEIKESSALIEVFTLNNYEAYENEEIIKIILFNKINQLPYNVDIQINLSNFNYKNIFDSDDSLIAINDIASDINSWLKGNYKDKINDKYESKYGLIVSSYYNEYNDGVIITDSKMITGGVHSYRFFTKIEGNENEKGKYDSYKDLVKKLQIPYIICCVSDSFHRLNMESFSELVFGISLSSFSKRKHGVITEEDQKPEISGFMFFVNHLWENRTEIVFIANPYAKFPFKSL